METMRWLQGWGRLGAPGVERRGEDLERLTEEPPPLARGLGRSYGDASLPPPDRPVAVGTRRADRILAFDRDSGRLRAESGLSLLEINRLLLRRGWFVPVSPGTQYVTLGGMVAADVHGKNQHVDGDFGHHVTRLRMRVASGELLWCSPEEHADLFFATIGGMGLTGHILEVEFSLRRIPSPWILAEDVRIPDIDAFLAGLAEAADRWPFTVGWIDCVARGGSLGRGVLMAGRWADASEAPTRPPRDVLRPRLPFDLPSWALGDLTVRAFNELYYRKAPRRPTQRIQHPEAFFYPLDVLRDWNRMYGRRGFIQYQCVLPRAAGARAVRRLLEELTNRGGASFLAVIKDFGMEGPGLLSFPMPGTTVALDLPMRGEATRALVDALDRVVLDEGGRIYLAKDALSRPEHFRAMEGARLERFREVRDRWDPRRRFRSALSVRLLDD